MNAAGGSISSRWPLIYLPPFFENNSNNKYHMWVELSVFFLQQYLNLMAVPHSSLSVEAGKIYAAALKKRDLVGLIGFAFPVLFQLGEAFSLFLASSSLSQSNTHLFYTDFVPSPSFCYLSIIGKPCVKQTLRTDLNVLPHSCTSPAVLQSCAQWQLTSYASPGEQCNISLFQQFG